jgi:arylsulfatase A-like enzyme
MNLLFITIDGARLDRIKKGNYYSKLINNSLFFPKTITYAPYTVAAMHAIFSGTYGTRTGVNSYWSNINFKKDLYKTLPRYLKDEGYLTHADVINKLVLPPNGFDEFNIHDELHDNLTERHIQLIDKYDLTRKQGDKFFLYLHYSNIHTGIMKNVLKKFDNFSKDYFKNKEENAKFYDKLFSSADTYLERIIEHCNSIDFFKDTLLVVVSDHGISIGEKFGERAYGVFCYDYTLIATSLFYHATLPQMEINQQVRSIDILPTILEFLEIPPDSSFMPIQGQSLLPITKGSTSPRVSFSQSGNPLKTGKPPKEPNVYAIRTDKWKYIKNIHDNSEELYDLVDDPNEDSNLINKLPEIVEKLRLKLDNISKS